MIDACTGTRIRTNSAGTRAESQSQLGLIARFMVGEVVAGILADSLALLSDAAHMLTDAGALLVVARRARLARPAGGTAPSGCGRSEILSAQANGATLLVLAA
jgi:cobalt-zinc-cadmium efflux system protein